MLLIGGAYSWDYTNSSRFCGTSCHTMPPEYTAYETSPHAQVACVECHIGREFIGNQIFRKAGDLKHIISMTFKTYEYPIFAGNMRPARESCEKCHTPEKFSDDSLRTVTHYQNNIDNTSEIIYLIMKTGGGAKQQGLGRGIHWHIINKVEYYSTDPLSQNIPYIRVHNDDGTITDYVDATTNFDSTTIKDTDLKVVDCITCHNRITHSFPSPAASVDNAMSHGLISPNIPDIHQKAVEVLSAIYGSQQSAMSGIAGLENYYRQYYNDFYSNDKDAIKSTIIELQGMYKQTVFSDQKVDSTTHPNNLGHINSAGCFRCHDGKHLNTQEQAIRLECNICHSIPVVATTQDFVAHIEISRGPEPFSHLNPNWISLHNNVFDETCSNCHTTGDPGGTSNISFCSNSACHGTNFQFAGFDAPALRQVLQAQLPTPAPTVTHAPVVGNPTYDGNIQSVFEASCTVCHNSTAPSAKLDLSTFSGVMAGSQDGVSVVPGDSANSLLIKIQSAKHFRNLTSAELALVKRWIDAGALEK